MKFELNVKGMSPELQNKLSAKGTQILSALVTDMVAGVKSDLSGVQTKMTAAQALKTKAEGEIRSLTEKLGQAQSQLTSVEAEIAGHVKAEAVTKADLAKLEKAKVKSKLGITDTL